MDFDVVVHMDGQDGDIIATFDNEEQARKLFNQCVSQGTQHPDEECIELRTEDGIIEYHDWEVN